MEVWLAAIVSDAGDEGQPLAWTLDTLFAALMQRPSLE
jgi:hypothetical protein